MGTPLPVRIFLVIIIILGINSCSERDTVFPMRNIYTKSFPVDSLYTYVQHLYTGDSKFLYTGERDSFVSYAIMQFSYPDTIKIDSVFLTLRGDSISDTLYLYRVLQKWTEGHILYDSLSYLKGSMFQSGYFNGDSVVIKLESIPEDFDSNGVLIFSKELHRFSSSEGKNPPILTIFSGDTSLTYHPYRDAFLCDHPMVGDTIVDTLLQGFGVGFVNVIYIPSDSIPLDISYSRFEIGVFSPAVCTLGLYYGDKLADREPSGDTTAYLSLIPLLDNMKEDSVDTMDFIPIKIKMASPFNVPNVFTMPKGSLKVYLMFTREEE